MPKPDGFTRTAHPDDIVLWPDGCWTKLDDLWRGGFGWKSDDYEIISCEDTQRLRDAGVLDEIG